MKEVYRIMADIYQPVSFMNTNSYKDGFVDFLLNARNAVIDNYQSMPIIKMSENTYSWLFRLFNKDTTFIKDKDGVSFWGIDIETVNIEDGAILFFVED